MANNKSWAEEYLKVVDNFWSEDEYEQGWKILQVILLEEPGCAKAHSYSGWYAQYQLKDKKTARMHYEYALHFDANLSDVYLNYGELLVEEKDKIRLKQLVKASEKMDKVDRAHLYNDLGRVYEKLEEYDNAIAQFRSGIKYTTDNYMLRDIKGNRKRVRGKRRMYQSWYSWLL